MVNEENRGHHTKKRKKEISGCLTAFVPPGILKTPSVFNRSSQCSDTKSYKSVKWLGLSSDTPSFGENQITEWEDLAFQPKLRKCNLIRQQEIYKELDRLKRKEERNRTRYRRERDPKNKRRGRDYNKKYPSIKNKRYPPRMRSQPHRGSFAVYAVFIISLLAVASLLTWAEWLHVNAYLKYTPLYRYTPVPCEPSPTNNGLVVHMDCPVTKMYKFYPAKEFSWNMDRVVGLFLETKVEMYQYVVTPAKFGVHVSGTWSDNKETVSFFSLRSMSNPNFWPAVPGQGRQFPPKLYAGGFELDPECLGGFKGLKRIPLRDDGYYKAPASRPPQRVDYYNSMMHNDFLYTGDPDKPEIGDMRVSFYTSDATHISAIGAQECDSYSCRIVPVSPRGEESKEEAPSIFQRYFGDSFLDSKYLDAVQVVTEGDHTADGLLSEAIAECGLPYAKLNLLRFSTFLLSLIVAVWSIGLIYPNRWFMWTGGRTGNFLGLLLSGVGSAMFVTCGLVCGTIWMLGSWVIGILLLFIGVLGLVLAVTLTCTMDEIYSSRNKDGYHELHNIPEEFDRNPPTVEMDHSLGARTKSESSFYQAI